MRALGSPVNSDYDIYNSGSGVNVYNATPDASNPRWVSFDIAAGDGTKNLDGTGGDFDLTVTIGSQVFDGAAQTKTSAAGSTRVRWQTAPLMIPANAAVTILLTSPNSADTDVDVTVQPYDVGPLQPGTVAATMDVVDASGIRTAVGLASANLDTQLADKTGYELASTGLDSISTTAPSGVASNFREMMVQTWRRFFKKSTMTSTQLKTYADNGTTVVTTQTVSDDGTTQTQGAAS